MDLKTRNAGAPVGANAQSAAAQASRAGRVGLWALGVGFGGFLLWAALAPLDEGVPTMGTVALDTKRKAVQHLSGGIVAQVNVREGQMVKAGDVLLRLDTATVQANHQVSRQRYLGLLAMQARLLAEQANTTVMNLPGELKAALGDPAVQEHVQVQQRLLQSRRAALQADLQVIEQSIAGLQATTVSARTIDTNRRQQLALLQEELKNTRGLVADGFAPRNRQLELERAVAETLTGLADVEGTIIRAQRGMDEQRQRAVARQQEYQKELQTQLAQVSLDVQAEADRYVATKADLGRTDIRSPADGQVVGLAIQTVGGVVQPSQKLMDIVPADSPLLLEAQVAPHLIDRVREGLLADIRFTAFSHSPQLVVEGRVESISQDLLTDPLTQMQYYLARVAVTPGGVQTLAGRRLQPGMPAELVIKTGERSMLTYLLSPLTKRLAASMKEE